jgi:putative membrane protein
MYTKRNYSFWMMFKWSKTPFFVGLVYSCLIGFIQHSGYNISLPWQPVSIIGIAVAFYLGFKNNTSYDRLWEARKIWGAIVNDSRSLGAATISFIQGEGQTAIQKELIYRHIAWLTALRHQLRLRKEWEHEERRIKGKYFPIASEDYHNKLNAELSQLVSQAEVEAYDKRTNTATQILATQAKRFQELKDQNYFDNFRHMELYKLLRSFYDGQGKSERIKNFPFPRQYASTALWLNFAFCLFLPFAMLDFFPGVDIWLLCLCPLMSALLIWIYFLMEKIGDYSENPFEGSFNDVPITSIARAIEIDLREMIHDTNIPGPLLSENGFLL